MSDVTQRIEGILQSYLIEMGEGPQAVGEVDMQWLCRLALAQEKMLHIGDLLRPQFRGYENDITIQDVEWDLAWEELEAARRDPASMQAALQSKPAEAESDKMAAVCQAENLVLELAQARRETAQRCAEICKGFDSNNQDAGACALAITVQFNL